MAIQQPGGAVRGLARGAIADSVFSRDGATIYVATGGTLTAYDVASGATGASWSLGTSLGGLDVSADGRWLVAVEEQTPATGAPALIYRIDLASGVATGYALPAAGGSAWYDAAFLPDGKVLLSSQGASTPLTTFDFSSGASTTTPQTFAGGSAMTPDRDHGQLAVLPAGTAGAPVFVYTAGTGITASHQPGADGVSGRNVGVQAISPGGDHLVQGTGLNLYDGHAGYGGSLASLYPFAATTTGLAYSPDGARLYALDSASREVFVLDAATHDVLGAYPVLASVGAANGFGDTLAASTDGRYLSVIAAGSLQVIDLTRAVSDGGTSQADTLVADQDHPVLYGFAGNDVLDSGAASTGYQLYGGPGDDTYLVHNVADQVHEAAGDGYDTVISTVSYTLPADVEALTLTGDAVIAGTGNELANTMTGNDAANLLAGLAGDDTLYGMGGNDLLYGGPGNDRLYGGDGNDTLVGGPGADTLGGGPGADTFLGVLDDMNGDRIADLGVGDRIIVSDRSLSGFGYSRIGSSLAIDGRVIDVGTSNVRLALSANGTGTNLAAVNHMAGLSDFDGDGHSDILWRNAGGGVSTWAVSGNLRGDQVRQGTFNAAVATSWSIADTGDFNGDGRSDVLWRNTGGSVAIWSASAGGFDQGSYLHTPVPTDWRIAGTGDVNGDGRDDILWQNRDGSLSLWTSTGMGTGTGFAEASYTHASVGQGWTVEGLGDVDGDGRADILWRNADGTVATWLAGGQGFVEGGFAAGIDRSWHVDGIGDFDGDGRDDILWRNDSGAVSLWRSNGTGFDQGVYNGQVDPHWHVAQVGDFNDDGKADILWHNDNGAVSTWQGTATGFDGGVYNASAAIGWSIAGHDFPM